MSERNFLEVSLAEAKSLQAEHDAGCNLFLMFQGQRIPFQTANEASGIISEFRDQSGMGSREMGGQFAIVNKAGKEVGYVSYNGRVWQGTRRNWKNAVCVYPKAKELCAS